MLAATLSLWSANALINGDWQTSARIVITDGRITKIEKGCPPGADDEVHDIILPGMGNLHSHAFQRGMAGLSERRGSGQDSFWTWREIMYRFLDRMGPDDIEAIASLAYLEMLETGITRVGEFHYVHHDLDGNPYSNPARMAEALVRSAENTGIGMTLLPVFYAHSGFGGRDPEATQKRFITSLEAFAGLLDATHRAAAVLPDPVVGIAAHSLRAVTPEELSTLQSLDSRAPFHIHVAEQEKEVADCIAWSGLRPVEWLLKNAEINDNWCLVHATHMTNAESEAVAASGAVAGLCSITEANLGDGIFPAPAYLSAGGKIGIGTDSNVRIDGIEELRLLEYGQRLSTKTRNVFAFGANCSTGAGLYQRALEGGARALGTAAAISIGASADFVSLDLHHPSLAGRQDDAVLDALIFAAGSTAIDCVWRHGRKVVSAGRHYQREAIVARYRRVLEKMTA